MPKYEVCVEVTRWDHIIVEAVDEEAAEKKACEIAESDPYALLHEECEASNIECLDEEDAESEVPRC